MRESATARRVRAVVLAGAGKTFCAGADVAWMAKTVTYTMEDNLQDAMAASRMFGAIDALPVPIIGRIHGAAIGGGAGLAAVCDIVVADEHADVRVPRGQARHHPGGDLAVRAREDRPVGRARAVPDRRAVPGRARTRDRPGPRGRASRGRSTRPSRDTSQEILAAAPQAIAEAKALIAEVWGRQRPDAESITARRHRPRRVSAEGQEGLRGLSGKANARLGRRRRAVAESRHGITARRSPEVTPRRT